MANYCMTNKAIADLNSIWEYTAEEWSENQADRYYYQILDTCQVISNNPNSGKSYDQVGTGLFGLKVSRHIIFYRILDYQSIEITRILHGRMDVNSRLKQ